MKISVISIILTLLIISCVESHKDLDFSKIKSTTTTSSLFANFDGFKDANYATTGDSLERQIQEIWHCDKLFIGQESEISHEDKNPNLIVKIENGELIENSKERITRIDSIFQLIKLNIGNLKDYDNLIIQYSTKLNSEENFRSEKIYKTK